MAAKNITVSCSNHTTRAAKQIYVLLATCAEYGEGVCRVEPHQRRRGATAQTWRSHLEPHAELIVGGKPPNGPALSVAGTTYVRTYYILTYVLCTRTHTRAYARTYVRMNYHVRTTVLGPH